MGLTNRLVRSQAFTMLMVTHSLKQVLSLGDHIIMFHQDRVIFDIAGVECTRLMVDDLLSQFERVWSELLADDKLLLK